jgi:sarcosine oxidase subunit beta
VAVVGAGIIGLAVARSLRGHGLEVVVLEREGIGSGASGVQPGGVRQQWGTRLSCLLARESLAFYRRAEEELESPVALGFRACGYLFLAHSEGALARLRANVAIQNQAGVPSRLVTPQEAAELAPGLRLGSIVGGAWCAEDGYFDRPQSVVEAFARGLRVEIAEVTRLRPDGGGWALELGGGGVVRAGAAVVAAGCATVSLLAPLGLELPIEPQQRHLFLSEPIRERLLEPLVISPERRFAAKQLGSGRVLASALDAAGDAEEQASRWRATVRARIRELLPLLEYVEFPICVEGVYDMTPDRQPAVGTVPGRAGLWVAAGFSGHGFMLAPAIGRIVADAIAGLGEDEALRVLDPARFAEGRLVPEPQVI